MEKKTKLTILLMVTALTEVSQNQGLLTTPAKNSRIVLADTKPKSKTTEKDDETIKAAKKAAKQLEKDQTQENPDLATRKAKTVKNKKVEKQLKRRIATVKIAIEAQKQGETVQAVAEAAVANLEANQTRENIDDAKNKVDAVVGTVKKGDFDNRINTVISAIETKEAEEAAQAEEARKAEEARQAEEAARQIQEQVAAEGAARRAQEQTAT